MDQELFQKACETVLQNRTRAGIGTLGEKTIHDRRTADGGADSVRLPGLCGGMGLNFCRAIALRHRWVI